MDCLYAKCKFAAKLKYVDSYEFDVCMKTETMSCKLPGRVAYSCDICTVYCTAGGFMFRYSLHHRLCNGRVRKVGQKISSCTQVCNASYTEWMAEL